MSTEQAWRSLTNNLLPAEQADIITTGDPDLIAIIRKTRAIIGTPK